MFQKKSNLLLTIFFAGLLVNISTVQASSVGDCSRHLGCEKKFCEIEKQIIIAQDKDNKRRVEGLNKALKEAKSHCTDKGLKKDLAGKIEEIREEISEYEIDLKEAKEDNKIDKIIKYEQKISEEKLKLKELLQDQ